jgi:hypothetical protein
MNTLSARNPQEIRDRIENIAILSWIALPGFELLVRQARYNIDPAWTFTIFLKHHGLTTVDPLIKRLQASDDNSEDFLDIRSHLILMLMRATVADAFEAIRVYCEDHNHMDFLRKQDWYHFARTIRNTYSHAGKVSAGKHRKPEAEREEKGRILSSSWRGKQFTESMFGRPISEDFFDFSDAQLFIDDMSRFCEELQTLETRTKGRS